MRRNALILYILMFWGMAPLWIAGFWLIGAPRPMWITMGVLQAAALALPLVWRWRAR